MVLLGCTPEGRVTEQHDVFFGIGTNLSALIPEMNAFWPEAKGKLHIDAWREVTSVGAYSVSVVPKKIDHEALNLYFLNLGGYKPGSFEEYHYKMLRVAPALAPAVKEAKKTLFYTHYDFKGAASHIDDTHGIDVDDAHKVTDLLDATSKSKYSLQLTAASTPVAEDAFHIGYLKIKSLT